MSRQFVWSALVFLLMVGCGNPIYQKVQQPKKHAVALSLERTPCFGKCPVYLAQFDLSKRQLTYEGRKFVNHEGVKTYELHDSDVRLIQMQLEEIDFLAFSDQYDGPVSDLPSCITTLTIDGEEVKQVTNRLEAPEKLIAFERLLDGILMKYTDPQLETY
jgi:hypothetical protein